MCTFSRILYSFCLGGICFLFILIWAGPVRAGNSAEFQLVLLKQDWAELKLGYTFPEAFERLKAAKETGSLLEIGLEDIESYHWLRQSITLTARGSAKLLAALPPEKEWKSNNRFLAKVKGDRGWGNPVEWFLHQKGFLVIVNNEPLYGGVCLEPMSQMAIKYPVLRPGMVKDRVVFSLLPGQIPFVLYDPISNQPGDWDAAVAPEGARDWNRFPPPMKNHFIHMGNRPEVQDVRNRIRDLRVKQLMEKAEKLK